MPTVFILFFLPPCWRQPEASCSQVVSMSQDLKIPLGKLFIFGKTVDLDSRMNWLECGFQGYSDLTKQFYLVNLLFEERLMRILSNLAQMFDFRLIRFRRSQNMFLAFWTSLKSVFRDSLQILTSTHLDSKMNWFDFKSHSDLVKLYGL